MAIGLRVPGGQPAAGPQLNQYSLARTSLLGLGLVAALTFASGIWIEPRLEQQVAPVAPPVEPAGILQRLGGASDPRIRERVLDEARAAGDRLLPLLREVLGDPEHVLVVPALDLAAVLGTPELAPLVRALASADDEEVRGRALLSAEQFEPWSTEQLFDFLTQGSACEKIAALHIITDRSSSAPWEQALALLLDDAAPVRRAALEAIPDRPPPRAMRAMLSMMRSNATETVVAGLQAVSRTEFVAAHQKHITDLLARPDSEIGMAALAVLAGLEEPLAEPEVVWALALDPRSDLVFRARAMGCLERTESFDADRIERRLDAMAPEVRYFAARCLLRAGRIAGVRALVGLVDERPADVALASRTLLAELAGVDPTAAAEEFASGMRSIQLPLPELPPATLRY